MEQTVRPLWLGCGTGLAVLIAMAIGSLETTAPWLSEVDRDDRQQIALLESLAQQRARLVEDLVAGDRSLFEVAAGFRELAQGSSVDPLHYLRMFHPDRSDDELYYLHVLMHVKVHCRMRETDNTLLESLWYEFEARRAAGTLVVQTHGESGLPEGPRRTSPERAVSDHDLR